jgi:hypothetical protein
VLRQCGKEAFGLALPATLSDEAQGIIYTLLTDALKGRAAHQELSDAVPSITDCLFLRSSVIRAPLELELELELLK